MEGMFVLDQNQCLERSEFVHQAIGYYVAEYRISVLPGIGPYIM